VDKKAQTIPKVWRKRSVEAFKNIMLLPHTLRLPLCFSPQVSSCFPQFHTRHLSLPYTIMSSITVPISQLVLPIADQDRASVGRSPVSPASHLIHAHRDILVPPDLEYKRTKKACIQCRRDKSRCDSNRPCGGCIKKGRETLCVDGCYPCRRAKIR
jgi:hypothetical protein